MDRLLELLRKNNIPIQYLTGSNQNDIGIVYSLDPTDEIKAQVAEILAGYDWSYEAEQVWQLSKKKQEAIERIPSDIPEVILYRNALKLIMTGFSNVVNKLNEVITAHNAKTNDIIEILPVVQEWDKLVQTVRILIKTE